MNIAETLTLLLTCITAVSSTIAAVAAWYSASADARHMRKVLSTKIDIILVIRDSYANYTPSQLQLELQQLQLMHNFSSTLLVTVIDGRVYYGANVDVLKSSPYDVVCYMLLTKYFKIAYVTNQGRKKYKKYGNKEDNNGNQ